MKDNCVYGAVLLFKFATFVLQESKTKRRFLDIILLWFGRKVPYTIYGPNKRHTLHFMIKKAAISYKQKPETLCCTCKVYPSPETNF